MNTLFSAIFKQSLSSVYQVKQKIFLQLQFTSLQRNSAFQLYDKYKFVGRPYYQFSQNEQKGQQTDQQQQKIEKEQRTAVPNPQIKASKKDTKEGVNKNNDNYRVQAAINSIKNNIQSDNAKNLMNKIDLSKITPQNALKFCVDAWKETFPNELENTQQKLQQSRARARELKQREEELQNLSEEQLSQIQGAIPDWKRTSLTVLEQEKQKRQSLASQLKGRVKQRINDTEIVKNIQTSESYQEYQGFQEDLTEIQSNIKERIHNSQSNLVQGTIKIIDIATSETTVTKAINKMRLVDPDFDLWKLENQANAIFKNVYDIFLNDDIQALEKVCGEDALRYFQVEYNQQTLNKFQPKFKEIVDIERAHFDQAIISENGLPYFLFSVKVQTILCNMSLDGKQIIEGSDDTVVSTDFIFGITYHSNPDVESIGHQFELSLVHPREVIHLLV